MKPHKALNLLESAIQQSGSGEHPTRPTLLDIHKAHRVLRKWLDHQRRYDIWPPSLLKAYGWLRVVQKGAENPGCCRESSAGEHVYVEELRDLIGRRSEP